MMRLYQTIHTDHEVLVAAFEHGQLATVMLSCPWHVMCERVADSQGKYASSICLYLPRTLF